CVLKRVPDSRSRVLALAATYRVPATSTAMPRAVQRPLLTSVPTSLQPPVVKLPPCPKTRSAIVSVVNGVSYSNTRLLKASATKTLPTLSTATPLEKQRLVALVPPGLQRAELKLPP